jgi:hypothetical protein
MTEFPGNSRQPKDRSERVVEQVVTGEVQSRKKSLGKRAKELFIGGDSKSVLQYVISEVLIPQAKDMITEGVSSGFERLIYGESRPPGRRFGSRPTGPNTHVNYNRYAVRGNNPIGRSVREERGPNATARTHGIDDILFATRVEAETVLDRMYDLLREYENASISDLYSLIGWSGSFVDQKWGWTDLQGSGVQRVRDGYLLNLPKPVSLD